MLLTLYALTQKVVRALVSNPKWYAKAQTRSYYVAAATRSYTVTAAARNYTTTELATYVVIQ